MLFQYRDISYSVHSHPRLYPQFIPSCGNIASAIELNPSQHPMSDSSLSDSSFCKQTNQQPSKLRSKFNGSYKWK